VNNVISRFVVRHFQPAEGYTLVSWLFLKLLALIYFAAFMSLAVQIIGLVGPDGILPYQEMLDSQFREEGRNAWWRVPTLFWFSASNRALELVAWAGCALSILLFLGLQRKLVLTLLFVFYLSLFHAGQTFLTFQWDTLLLETGFLAIFLVNGPTRLLIFLYHWLLFRFRFMSGVAKLASGDPAWSSLDALKYYFETQPLPHVISWYAHQLPEWLLKGGVAFTFFSELIVPFFIFLPRPFRLFAAAITILMQLLIIATSNHNFVNLLTILLCLFLLDDRILNRVMPVGLQQKISFSRAGLLQIIILPVAGLVILFTSVTVFSSMLSGYKQPAPVRESALIARSYGLGHIFHIFPVMQTERQELIVEGSHDGLQWKGYEFRYKPGALDKRPEFIVPHQPRLDWMIWFVPTQHPKNMFWFDRFLSRLWEGEEQVTKLLATNPFENEPPHYIRVLVYRYKFTTGEERTKTGNWWKREYLGQFPNVSPRRP